MTWQLQISSPWRGTLTNTLHDVARSQTHFMTWQLHTHTPWRGSFTNTLHDVARSQTLHDVARPQTLRFKPVHSKQTEPNRANSDHDVAKPPASTLTFNLSTAQLDISTWHFHASWHLYLAIFTPNTSMHHHADSTQTLFYCTSPIALAILRVSTQTHTNINYLCHRGAK